MLNPEQREYILSLKKTSPAPDHTAVTELLKGASWPEDEIEEALHILHADVVPASPVSQEVPAPTDDALHMSPTSISPRKHSGKVAVVLIGVLITMVAGACGYYAYTQGVFSPVVTLAPDKILSQLLEKMRSIETAQYKAEFSLATAPRDSDAQPFMMEESVDPEVMARYKRDQDRFRDIEKIRSTLNVIYYASSTYPKSLAGLNLVTTDPLGKPYLYAQDTADSYTLQVTFETPEARGAAQGNYYGMESKESVTESLDAMTVTLSPNDYFSSYSFEGRPQRPKFLGLVDLASVEEYLPANLEAQLTLEGVIDQSSTLPVNTRLKVAGNASFDDFQVAFDVEGMKIADTYYGIVHKLPSFFGTLSQIKGTWVMATEQDLRGSGYGDIIDAYIPTDENERTKEIQQLGEQARKIIEIADQMGLIVMTEGPVIEKKESVKLVRYSLALASDKVLSFYESVLTALEPYGNDAIIKRDEALIAYLKSDAYTKVSQYMKENISFTLWTDAKGFPVTMKLASRYVPSEIARALSGKQINSGITFTFWDINKPVMLTKPEGATSYDDFMSKVTGKSKEELLIERQQNQIRTIRSALETYKSMKGTYPEVLTKLTEKIDDSMDTEATGQDFMYSLSNPPLKSIPKDVYTNSDFVYSGDRDNYKLEYTVQLPQYVKGKNPRMYYTYGNAKSPSDLYMNDLEDIEYKTLYVPTVRDGKNVATADYVSDVQALTADSDADELSDELEKIIGTDPLKADTDGDMFDDGEEIQTNSDPLGPGKFEDEYNMLRGF